MAGSCSGGFLNKNVQGFILSSMTSIRNSNKKERKKKRNPNKKIKQKRKMIKGCSPFSLPPLKSISFFFFLEGNFNPCFSLDSKC
jgi:hypothetical protein